MLQAMICPRLEQRVICNCSVSSRDGTGVCLKQGKTRAATAQHDEETGELPGKTSSSQGRLGLWVSSQVLPTPNSGFLPRVWGQDDAAHGQAPAASIWPPAHGTVQQGREAERRLSWSWRLRVFANRHLACSPQCCGSLVLVAARPTCQEIGWQVDA